MTDHHDPTREDQDLHDYLQSRIPEPGANYWESIDARLRGEPVPAAGVVTEVDTDLADADTNRSDTDATVTRLTGMNNTTPLRSSRALLIAAGFVLLAGIGAFALLNRSNEEPVGVAATTDAEVDETTDAPASNANDDDADPASSDDDADSAVEASPASPEDIAELNAARDASPLQALQARLAAPTDGTGQEGPGTAGPYCFSHPDSYIFPADELDDRRALLQLDIAADGFVNFTAMQGETIVITGSGMPEASGTLLTTPVAVVGASGAPPYEILIGDDRISVSAGEAPLALVDCEGPETFDRINTMFTLLTDPTAGWEFDAWPPDDAVLSSAGLGPIRIGMTVSELEAELGVDLAIETIDGNVAGACGQVAPTTSIARDVWILLELTGPDDAIIRRVSTFSGPWFTPSGITVGSTQQDVLETFPGQIEESPHVYRDGTYMRYLPNNAADPNTVEFVNEDGTIAEIRVGDRGWVGLVEGCA